MLKSVFAFLFILLISCNNNHTAKNEPVIPAEEKNLRDLIAQYPDSILLKENLIEYFHASDNYDQAISETQKLIASDSTSARLWDIAGRLYAENQDTIKAIKAFEKALDINADPQYIISLGVLYAQTKDSLALAMADGLLMAPKANAAPQATFIKGLYYSSIGDKKTAITYFNDCISLNYTFMDAYREQANCFYDMGKYNEAIIVLKKAISIQSKFDEAYYWLGKCYEKTGNRQEAIDNYQTALAISPDYIEAKDALAKMGITN